MRRMTVRGRLLLGSAVAIMGLTLVARPGLAQDSAATAAMVATARPDSADHAYRYRLLGVYDAASGQPIEGAEVSDAFTGASARTSRTGTVSLFFLPDGGSLVRIRKFGFGMQTMVVAISPTDTVPVTVALEPAVQLPEVVTTGRTHYISPNLRGFEERRLHAATGYFIPDSVLRHEENRTLGNVLLTHVPGIVIIERQHAALLEPSPRCTTGGPPNIYVDGVLLAHVSMSANGGGAGETQKLRAFARPGRRSDASSPATTPMDLSAFKVTDLAGVEYYPDGNMVPAEFAAPTKACGVLLLWTREK